MQPRGEIRPVTLAVRVSRDPLGELKGVYVKEARSEALVLKRPDREVTIPIRSGDAAYLGGNRLRAAFGRRDIDLTISSSGRYQERLERSLGDLELRMPLARSRGLPNPQAPRDPGTASNRDRAGAGRGGGCHRQADRWRHRGGRVQVQPVRDPQGAMVSRPVPPRRARSISPALSSSALFSWHSSAWRIDPHPPGMHREERPRAPLPCPRRPPAPGPPDRSRGA